MCESLFILAHYHFDFQIFKLAHWSDGQKNNHTFKNISNYSELLYLNFTA